MKNTLISIVLFLLLDSIGLAQNSNDYNVSYTKATISLINYERIEACNIFVKNDTLFYNDVKTFERYKIPTNDVNYLSVNDGTHFGKGALYGGLFMGVLCLSAAMQTTSFNNDAVPIALGFIGGGAFLGGLIGAMVPKSKTVFINKKYSLNDIETDIYFSENYVGMRLKFMF